MLYYYYKVKEGAIKMSKRKEMIKRISHKTVTDFIELNGLEKLQEKENDLDYFVDRAKVVIKNDKEYNDYVDNITYHSYKMFLTELKKKLEHKIFQKLLINDLK